MMGVIILSADLLNVTAPYQRTDSLYENKTQNSSTPHKGKLLRKLPIAKNFTFWPTFEAQITQCNGTAQFKNVNNCLNTNIYSYLETLGGLSSNLYLKVVFFNASVN
jgi:hypothetical protein